MPRIAYVNGRYVPHRAAAVHVEDRGYQFSDGVYEVCEIRNGQVIDMPRHLDRLNRSLTELRIAWPMHRKALEMVMLEVIRRNGVHDGIVYIQVTRGVAPRDHFFPSKQVRPAIVVTAKSIDPSVGDAKARTGVKVLTMPDNRWERVDIKSVSLLPNVLARQAAREKGAQEAWFVAEDGTVTEGAATNAWIVTMDGELVTRPADHGILRGITRATTMDVAASLGLTLRERPFTVQEALEAKEAFITSATSEVMPVVEIDGRTIANGRPGSVTQSLRDAFFCIAEKTRAC